MDRIIIRKLLAGLVVVALSTASACAADRVTRGAGPATEQAILCPSCEIVWVERIDVTDPYVMSYRTEEAVRCPDCVSKVVNFFRTGDIEHTCSSCDGTLKVCTVHRE